MDIPCWGHEPARKIEGSIKNVFVFIMIYNTYKKNHLMFLEYKKY